MRFTRIKVTDKIVELDWTEKSSNGETKDVKLNSEQRPMPALLQAMAAFREYVVDLLELPAWAEQMRITTLNISESQDGRRGLIVTCVRPVEKASGRPLVINTPSMTEPKGDSGDVAGFLPDDVLTLVRKAEVAAGAFVKGDREQTELALGAKDAETPPDDMTKKRRAKKGEFIPEVGALANAGAQPPRTDEQIRAGCLLRNRDVPLKAVGRWISSERESVNRWLDAHDTIGLEIPAVIQRDGTPSLLDDLAAKGDGWTQEAPPPKAGDVEPVQ